jgi:putative flippase GtrA
MSGRESQPGGVSRQRLAGEFSRYFAAGSLAFGSDFLVLVALTELAGVNYLVSNIFGFCCGLLVSYLLCVRWVFVRRRLSEPAQEFAIFVLLALVGLALNEGVLWIAVELAGQHYAVAKVVATGAVFVVNFLMKKIVLFR